MLKVNLLDKETYIVFGLREDKYILDWVGGKTETYDTNEVETAQRECTEEMGGHLKVCDALNASSTRHEFMNPLTQKKIVVFEHVYEKRTDFYDDILDRVPKTLVLWDYKESKAFDGRAPVRKTFVTVGAVKESELKRALCHLPSIDDVVAKELMLTSHFSFLNPTNQYHRYSLRGFAAIVYYNVLCTQPPQFKNFVLGAPKPQMF